MYEIYKNQVASSYEKTFGRDYLGEELSCLSFWILHDKEMKGYMNLKEAGQLFRTLKFNSLFLNDNGKLDDDELTLKKLKNEFSFNLRNKPNELIKAGTDTEDTLIRFDFVRDIFLERGL